MQQELISILDKNSEKNLTKISAAEIEEVKKVIDVFINEIKMATSQEEKHRLIDFRFGISKNTILHVASKFGDESEVVKALIETAHEKYVDVKNEDDFTPLHFAAMGGHLGAVQALISAGADKSALVSEKKRRWAPIHYAAQYGHEKVVELLIQSGVDKEIKTAFGLTPLLVAAEFGHEKVIKFLLSIGARCDVQTIEENHKMTALHYAVIGNYKDATTALLLAKIDKEKETTSGLTALEFAAKNNVVAMVDLLLKFGASKCEAALKIAQQNKSEEAVNEIKKYQKAKNNFFNAKFLKNSSASLITTIQKYDRDNLSEAMISLSDGCFVNALGVLSLKHQMGLFKKVTKSFPEFVNEIGLANLSEALTDLKTLTDL